MTQGISGGSLPVKIRQLFNSYTFPLIPVI